MIEIDKIIGNYVDDGKEVDDVFTNDLEISNLDKLEMIIEAKGRNIVAKPIKNWFGLEYIFEWEIDKDFDISKYIQ